MANNFNITISAVDRTTATVKKINDSMSRTVRPITNMQRSFKTFGKEVARNPIAKSLVAVSRAAKGAALSIAKVSAPLAGLTGIGTIAGIAQLATEWGRVGFELKRTSSSLGVSTSSLHNLRGAAKLAGVSADEMTGALGNLNQALFDAQVGNDPELPGILNHLKIGFHETADGGYDLLKVLRDVSAAVAAQKTVGGKHKILQRLGIDSLYPLVANGSDAIDGLVAKSNRLNPAPSKKDVEQGERLQEKVNELKAAATNIMDDVGKVVTPITESFVERETRWLTDNRSAIADHISKKAPAFLDPLGYWEKLENKRLNGATLSPKPTIERLVPEQRKKLGYNNPALDAYAESVEKNLSLPKGILNSVKNYGERSNSDAVSPKGARGVMQFMPRTWAKYGEGDITDPIKSIDAAGRYFKDLLKRYDGNVDAAITEYNGGVRQAQAVKNGFKPWVAETANYLDRVKSGMAQANGGADSQSQQVGITVVLPNAPQGTTVTAKTGSGEDVPVRISRSMQSLAPL